MLMLDLRQQVEPTPYYYHPILGCGDFANCLDCRVLRLSTCVCVCVCKCVCVVGTPMVIKQSRTPSLPTSLASPQTA